MAAYAWVRVVATAAPKGRTFVASGTPATALKVGKAGAGDTAAVEL
jgi:hypothetical protein